MTRGRERRDARRLSAPPRPDLLAGGARRRRGGAGAHGRRRRRRTPASATCRRPRNRSWRSPAPSPCHASCWCSTSRRRPCRRPTSRACSTCCAACAQSGIGIVYVTHRLDEVFRIADRVTVLRDGRRVTTDAVAETTPAALVHSIVGRSLSDLFVKPSPSTAEIVLSVDELIDGRCRPGVVHASRPARCWGWSACAAPGTTWSGGRSSATSKIVSGSVSLRGGPLRVHAPRDAIRRRIGFVSSKRGEESLARSLTVRENLFINPVTAGAKLLKPMNPGGRAGAGAARAAPLFGAPAGARAGHRHALRRQPAEGDRGALDGGRQPSAGAGGADLRRRRRLQGGDLPAPAEGARRGPRRPADLVGFRGGRRHLPSRADLRPRQRDRRARPRRAVDRAADRARFGRRREEDRRRGLA